MGQDLVTSAEAIRSATRRTLEVADELGAESVALPAFGTGVGGFPLDECARIMVAEAVAFDAARCAGSSSPSMGRRRGRHSEPRFEAL